MPASRIGHLYCSLDTYEYIAATFMRFFHQQMKFHWKEWPYMLISRKHLVAPVEEFSAVWWRYGVCPIFAKKIKILIVQYAVITEQTSSPRAFSHLSAFKENLRCNSLLLSLFQSHIFFVLLSFSPQCSFHTNCWDGGSLHQLGAPRLDEFSGQPVLPAGTGEKDLFPGWSWNNICRLRTAELIRRLTE